jgi:predicted aldo/keto reductase-like oxidoreductase
MHTKDLFHALCSNYETYKQLHNQTAETDLKIIELFSKGKNAVQIAMEVPCSEATVYRARERVERFLQDELHRFTIKLSDTFYMHNAVARGIYHLSLQSHKLFYLLIHAQQNFRNHVVGNVVHQYMPGLRNHLQRDATLLELNNLLIELDEIPKRSIKIFESVVYDKAKYRFKLTKEALPYFDKGYAFFKMLGIEDWLE